MKRVLALNNRRRVGGCHFRSERYCPEHRSSEAECCEQHAAHQPTGTKATGQDSTMASTKHHASKSKWSKEQIKEAQAGLSKAGYYKGAEDGIYGKETRAAVKQYQKANKMPVTGELNDSLLTHLKSS